MKIGDRVKYKTSEKSLKDFHGYILGFKADKINVSKYRYSDFSGELLPTWIDKEDIV
jgi:hypothetical protein